MGRKELRELIKENSSLFWYIPEQEKENISPELLVETVLNYGDEKSVRRLFDLMGINEVADIFYKHISGKRVNYSGRTVISPDPSIEINEVGIPYEIAKVVTVSETVTDLNIKKLSPYEYTFISSLTNGSIIGSYAPSSDAYDGEAYEVSLTKLAPEWQKIYEGKALEIIKKL